MMIIQVEPQQNLEGPVMQFGICLTETHGTYVESTYIKLWMASWHKLLSLSINHSRSPTPSSRSICYWIMNPTVERHRM